jgi:hypothetical protein
MRGTKLKNGRLIVAAAAALALGHIGSSVAMADNIAYQTGFEPTAGAGNPATFNGSAAPGTNVVGQNGFLSTSNGTAGSTAGVVTSPSPREGTQSLEISHVSGGTLAVAPHTSISSSNPFTVTTEFDLNFTAPTSSTNGTGPFFGIDLFGNNGNQFIGSFGVDAASGDLVDTISTGGTSSSGADLSQGSAPTYGPLTAASWNTLSVVASYLASGEVQLQFYLGTPIPANLVDTETTTGDDITSFDYAYLTGGPGGSGDQAGVAYFDNYSVSTSAAIPEPASLGLVAFAGMLLVGRRSRKSGSAL